MQQQAMKSNLVDLGSDRRKIGSRNYDQPLCPKPIRLSPSIPDFLKPIRCNKHSCSTTLLIEGVSGYSGRDHSLSKPSGLRLNHHTAAIEDPITKVKRFQQNIDEGNGVLNMIIEKNADGRESICNGCLPCCYSGSPPRRTENPLVHDVEFLHQVEVVSPLLSQTKLSNKFGITSASTM